MSWSASFSDIDGNVKDDYDPNVLSGGDNAPLETKEAFDAAVEAAIGLIKSRALGAGVRFNVSLNGHANVGHAPSGQWVNDCVTVSISQVSE